LSRSAFQSTIFLIITSVISTTQVSAFGIREADDYIRRDKEWESKYPWILSKESEQAKEEKTKSWYGDVEREFGIGRLAFEHEQYPLAIHQFKKVREGKAGTAIGWRFPEKLDPCFQVF